MIRVILMNDDRMDVQSAYCCRLIGVFPSEIRDEMSPGQRDQSWTLEISFND